MLPPSARRCPSSAWLTMVRDALAFSPPRGYFDHSKPVPLIDNSLVKELAHSAP